MNADRLNGLDILWRVPACLSKGVEFWSRVADATERFLHEKRKTPHPVLHILIPAPLLDPSRYSSYLKLLHVTAWVFCFIRIIRPAHQLFGYLTASEITKARLHWTRTFQTECFSAELDALRRSVDQPRESKIARFNTFL